jgi:hypothetical protein
MRYLLLFSFLWSHFPAPRAAVKSTDERYPCQHCACSCSTAAQCWRSCCCFSDREKLAWARARGVQPPAWLVAKVASASNHSKTACRADRQEKKCCSAGQPPSHRGASPRHACSTNNDGSLAGAVTVLETRDPKARLPRVFCWDDSLCCKRLGMNVDPTIPKIHAVHPVPNWNFLGGEVKSLNDRSAPSVPILPPVPPPRFSA